MRGHIRKRGKSWQAIVTIADPVTGKRRQLSGTRPTRTDAERLLVQLLTEAGRSSVVGSTATVGELLAAWQEARAPEWSPVNVRSTRMLVETYIEPAIGKVRLTKLKTADLDRFYRSLRQAGGRGGEPLAAGTVARVHTVVRSALGQAVRWEWITDNPAARASIPKGEKHRVEPPDPSEVLRLIDAATEDDEDFGTFLLLAAATGARRGELCALRWTDVAPDASALTIARALSMGDAIVERQTKTGNVRRVSLDEQTSAVLVAHRDRVRKRAADLGIEMPEDAFVFSLRADGEEPWRPDLVTHRWVRLRRRHGLESVRLHDLRHFHATRLLAAGVDLTTVAGRLGHAGGGRTTLAVYAHFLEEADAAAATAIGRVLSRDVGPEPICEECGNDLATEGFRYCLDCLEAGVDDG